MHSFETSSAFTRAATERVASKVMADLEAMRDYYEPDGSVMRALREELAALLPGGYMFSVQYGFQRGGSKVVALEYKSRPSGLPRDDAPGGVSARVDVSGARWFSHLVYSKKWHSLAGDQRRRILDRIPVARAAGREPGDGGGRWTLDKSYSSQGAGVQRRTFSPGRWA